MLRPGSHMRQQRVRRQRLAADHQQLRRPCHAVIVGPGGVRSHGRVSKPSGHLMDHLSEPGLTSGRSADTVRYVNVEVSGVGRDARRALPPGPRWPRAWQTAAWISRPGPFLERCRARHGDVFTVALSGGQTFVFLAHPDDVKRTFTGDPNLLRAGEANLILRPIVGSRSVLLLDEPQHMVDRKLMLPSFHGER